MDVGYSFHSQFLTFSEKNQEQVFGDLHLKIILFSQNMERETLFYYVFSIQYWSRKNSKYETMLNVQVW